MSLRRSATLTEAKLEANRRNARRSTGPRTEAGKHKASLNRLKHGAWATAGCYAPEALRALGENPEEYQELLARLRQAEGPCEDPLWSQQVEDLARLYWRRKRLERTLAVLASRRMQEAEEEAGEEVSEEERAAVGREEALLVTLTPEGMELERHLEAVERAIDRKTRLLLRLREEAERRRTGKAARSATGAKPAPVAKSEARRGEPDEDLPLTPTIRSYIQVLEEALGMGRSGIMENEVRSQKVLENTEEFPGFGDQLSGEDGRSKARRQQEDGVGEP